MSARSGRTRDRAIDGGRGRRPGNPGVHDTIGGIAASYGFLVTEVLEDDEGTGWPDGSGRPGVPAWCEHGPGAHDGGLAATATAPVAARAWLLIEYLGPWAHAAVETELPGPLAALATEADRAGIRVQLIRRPLRPSTPAAHSPLASPDGPALYAAWTAGPEPWVRRLGGVATGGGAADLAGIAEGVAPAGADPAGPLFLVCAHARRDRCCGRLGGPLARSLAARYPDQVWETTHLGGHKHAANLALLPHGLYYGPVDLPAALGAIEAYQRGEVTAHRFRGRAGHDQAWQQAEHARLTAHGTGTGAGTG
jgi:hypothetical protein